MPASIPVATIHGSNLDLVLGPPADLTSCFFDGDPKFSAKHGKSDVMLNYLAHESGFVEATPQYEITAPVIFKQAAGTFATMHPGTGVSRSLVPIMAERTAFNFPADPSSAGYFKNGAMEATTPIGSHTKCTLNLKLILFDVTNPISGAA